MTCNRCGGSGMLNHNQIVQHWPWLDGDPARALAALEEAGLQLGVDHDVQVCDCCGDGENWHGVPGQHDNDDAMGGVAGCS